MQELESAHVGWHCLQIKNVEGLAALLGKKDNADKTRLLRQVVRMLKKEGLLKKQEGEVMIAKSAVELRCWNMRWGLSGKSLVLCMPLALAKMNDVIDLSIWFCPYPSVGGRVAAGVLTGPGESLSELELLLLDLGVSSFSFSLSSDFSEGGGEKEGTPSLSK